MADFVLKSQVILIGSHDLSGRINAVALDAGADALDNTTFGDTTRSFMAGLKTASLAVEGFMDLTDHDLLMFGNIGAAKFPASVLVGPNEGDYSYGMEALAEEYKFFGEVGEMAPFSAVAQTGDGAGLIRGTLMHNAARASTANGTARQLGAVSATQKVYAAMHVLAASGTTPTLDVIVQSDNAEGFPSAANRITFAQKTAIGSEWAAPVAGAITDDWWRLSWTIGGSGPSFTFAVWIGIQ